MEHQHGPRTSAHRHEPGVPGEGAFELFYDLVYVAGVVVLTQSYSTDPGWRAGVWLLLVFSLLWAMWLRTTLLLNRRTAVSPAARTLMVAQMLLVLLVAVAAGDATIDQHALVGPLLAAALVLLALLHLVGTRREGLAATPERRRVAAYLLTAVLFAVSPWLSREVDLVLAVCGLALLLAPTQRFDRRAAAPRVDAAHLVERMGALTIIVLGETFVKVGLASLKGGLVAVDWVVLPVATTFVFAAWWIYFADVPAAAAVHVALRPRPWTMAHFPLHLSAVALAVGCSELLVEGDGPGDAALRSFAVPLVAMLLALALLVHLSNPPHRVRAVGSLLTGSAVLVALTAVTATTDLLRASTVAVLEATVTVAVVVVGRPVRR